MRVGATLVARTGAVAVVERMAVLPRRGGLARVMRLIVGCTFLIALIKVVFEGAH